MNSQNLMNQYQGMQLKSDVDAANPQISDLLLNGALQNLVAAKAKPNKGGCSQEKIVGRAMSILEYLRVSPTPEVILISLSVSLIYTNTWKRDCRFFNSR